MNGGDAVLANHTSVMVVLNVVMGEEDDDTFAVRGGSSLMAGKVPINCERIHTWSRLIWIRVNQGLKTEITVLVNSVKSPLGRNTLINTGRHQRAKTVNEHPASRTGSEWISLGGALF